MTRRPMLVAGMVVAAALGVGCDDLLPPPHPETDGLQASTDSVPHNPGSEPRTEPDPDPIGPAPALISPIEGALIAQNDSTIGCGFHPQRGYGFRIQFVWRAVPGDTVAGYQIFAKNRNVMFPILNHIVAADSSFNYGSCNSFVIDRNLVGWEWKVRAMNFAGQFSEWSALAEFAFAPCRHGNAVACSAPPGSLLSASRVW